MADPKMDDVVSVPVVEADAERSMDFSGEIGEAQGIEHFRIEADEVDEVLFRDRKGNEEKIDVPNIRYLVQYAASVSRGELSVEEFVIAYAMQKKARAGEASAGTEDGYSNLLAKFQDKVSTDTHRMTGIEEKAKKANIDWKKVEEQIAVMRV